jgi:hypothetical protein
VAYLLWHFLRHPVSTGDPGEVPIIGPQVASHIEYTEKSDKSVSPNDKPVSGKKKKTILTILVVLTSAAVTSAVIFLRRRGHRDAGD